MIKPQEITSSKYEFECSINPLDLNEDRLIELGLDPGNPLDLAVSLKAGGEFTVEWDDDIPMIQVTHFIVEGAIIPNKTIITPLGDIPARRFVDLDDTEVDFDYISEKIDKYGDHAYWEEDHLSSLVDAATDEGR